jgi:hypothetical protein
MKYRPGDALRFHTNLPSLRIKAGQVGTVLEVKTDQNLISIKIGEGPSQRHIADDPKSRPNVSVFETQERAIAVGERIQFTTRGKRKPSLRAKRPPSNSSKRTEISPSACKMVAGSAWNLKDYNHVDHAYTMTSHSSQGMPVDRVLIHVDTTDSRVRGLVDKTLSYVATSRARYDAQIFTDDANQLGRALSART